MEQSDLNGFYAARFFSDLEIPPGMYQLTSAHFVIKDGHIGGVGDGGILIVGIATIAVENSVDVVITMDPTVANSDVLLFDGNGNSGRDPQTRSATLKITVVDGRVELRGNIKFGVATATVSARRVAGFKDAHV